MLKLWIVILSLAGCSNSNTCVIDKVEFIKAVELLYEKDILSFNKDSLAVTINSDSDIKFDFTIGQELTIGSKNIKIVTRNKIENHWLYISQTKQSSQKENRMLVFFKALDGAYEYSGEITFDCIDGKYKVGDVHFVSSIN
ncbi:MAG TPA: hypothetical protein VLM43_06825 [Desulfobacterales bacterium]|nr:hypothetical protein [Desulfobacterales bacterium]